MCQESRMKDSSTKSAPSVCASVERPRRRGKRDKKALVQPTVQTVKKKSRALQRHGGDKPSGGWESILPSLIGISVLSIGIMAQRGFRGRVSVAGIDLGTTNSVICVQALSKGVGQIDCIPDINGSPIVPSVVSFPVEHRASPSNNDLPKVIVGHLAKQRIESHPHHTLYHAKRVLGRSFDDPAIGELQAEVEFSIQNDSDTEEVTFQIPAGESPLTISPIQVGAFVIRHLIKLTDTFLGHDNVRSAVICVPAKFDDDQRTMTRLAFKEAGVAVARVIEEPTAAALAYGLHRKANVNYILVYDFGGGTLDVSLLYVSNDFVDVMGSDGDDRLGGADFDAAIAHHLLKHHSSTVEQVAEAMKELVVGDEDVDEMLTKSCPMLESTPLCTVSSLHTLGEELKISMSSVSLENSDDEAVVESNCFGLPAEIDKLKTVEQFCESLQPQTLRLSREEYISSVQSLFDRAILPITRLLDDLDLTTTDIDEIVMVGGSTRIPQIRSLVQKALPTARLNTHIDPDITVAYGAASIID